MLCKGNGLVIGDSITAERHTCRCKPCLTCMMQATTNRAAGDVIWHGHQSPHATRYLVGTRSAPLRTDLVDNEFVLQWTLNIGPRGQLHCPCHTTTPLVRQGSLIWGTFRFPGRQVSPSGTTQGAPDNEDVGEESDEDEGEETAEFKMWSATADAYVSLVRRFCDTVAPLAFGSLASKDALVRKLSWVCLSLIYRGISMGGNVSGWSARPQLELVVESVLRGLKQRRDNIKMNEDDDMYYVPVLPTVTALFLGQSFQIAGSPSSPLFNAVNTYFLSNTNNVFTDLNALPAFTLLFSSSSPDAAKERAWVLKLLVDGVRGSHDYQVAARR